VRVLAPDLDLGVDRRAHVGGEIGKFDVRVFGLQRQLGVPVAVFPVDRDPGAVRATIGHGHQHLGQHRAQLRLKRPVLQK